MTRRAWVTVALAWVAGLLSIAALGILAGYEQPGVVHVVGSAMAPTLTDGDYVLVSYRVDRTYLQRGDIVLLRDPFDSNKKFIKRIVGLPGEDLSLKAGATYINNERLAEPYLKSPWTQSTEWPPLGTSGRLPSRNYFVMGDNRDHSADSRVFGPVTSSSIEAIFVRKF